MAKLPNQTLLNEVLCCPECRNYPLIISEDNLCCVLCSWHSETKDIDTLSFTKEIFEVGQTRTKSRHESGSRVAKNLKRINKNIQKYVFWRKYVFGDDHRLTKFIDQMRYEEMKKVTSTLSARIFNPKRIGLEIGVGFQDHRDLYKMIAHNILCSDIYRDTRAVSYYYSNENIFYNIMNVGKLPIRESSIDILFTSHVVEHFPDRTENLKSLFKIMKPDSISCHVVPTRKWVILGHVLETFLNLLVLRPRIGAQIHGEYDTILEEIQKTGVNAWKELFESCGFKVVEDYPGTLGLFPLPFIITKYLGKLLKLYGSHIFILRTEK